MLPESTIHAEKSYTIASPDIVWQCFEDELILIHLGTGVYYSVTPGGAAIWRLMEAGYTPAGIVSHVENGPAGEQILSFWQRLLEEGLIAPAPDGARAAAPQVELPPASELAEPSLAAYKDMQDLFLLDPIHDVDEAGWPSYQLPSGN